MRFPGALISAANVSFSYGKGPNATPVLQDVSLTLHPGSRIALVGRNGEGKSTLARVPHHSSKLASMAYDAFRIFR